MTLSPSGWAVWFSEPDAAESVESAEAARLVCDNCVSRGIHPAIVRPGRDRASDIEARLQTGASLVVLSDQAPPPAVASRVVMVGKVDAAQYAARVEPIGAPQELALHVLEALEKTGFIPVVEDVYTPEEEERLRKALDDLGYL